MKIINNKDFMNAVYKYDGTSKEFKERIGIINSKEDLDRASKMLNDYPTLKNEFIGTLTNKIIPSDFFSLVYENPTKELKGPILPYGTSAEQIFVQHAETKGFLESAVGETYDSASALLGKKEAIVRTMYTTRNFMYLYEVSISDQQLKGAFFNENGLSELVNQLVGSLTSGAELKEYQDVVLDIKAAANGKYLEMDLETPGAKGLVKEIDIPAGKGVMKPMAVKEIGANPTAQDIAVAVRSVAGRLKFMTNKFNMAGVTTFSNKQELVFISTPEVIANLDVNAIAVAFKVSATDVTVKIIEVDELPQKFIGKGGSIGNPAHQNKACECFGIVMDKRFIQLRDTVNETRNTDNGRALMNNIFLHRHGILGTCYFQQCVALVDELPAVTQVRKGKKVNEDKKGKDPKKEAVRKVNIEEQIEENNIEENNIEELLN